MIAQLCDFLFFDDKVIGAAKPRRPKVFSAFGPNADFSSKPIFNIDFFAFMASKVLIHEVCIWNISLYRYVQGT